MQQGVLCMTYLIVAKPKHTVILDIYIRIDALSVCDHM